jgi:hypothetical protein
MNNLSKGNIIKVTFFAPVRRDYYFGSLAAIYEKFTPSQIGCNLETLWGAKIEQGKPKATRSCVVSKHTFYRKKQDKKK